MNKFIVQNDATLGYIDEKDRGRRGMREYVELTPDP